MKKPINYADIKEIRKKNLWIYAVYKKKLKKYYLLANTRDFVLGVLAEFQTDESTTDFLKKGQRVHWTSFTLGRVLHP